MPDCLVAATAQYGAIFLLTSPNTQLNPGKPAFSQFRLLESFLFTEFNDCIPWVIEFMDKFGYNMDISKNMKTKLSFSSEVYQKLSQQLSLATPWNFD